MASPAVRILSKPSARPILRNAALVIAGSFLVAFSARVTIPLPFTPVPLTLQNFAVLLVALVLGWRRGTAAVVLYLIEGASGMPVFTPGAGGLAQLFGPTGGYLLAYPAMALVTGFIAERARGRFHWNLLASAAGEIVLFVAGVSWLVVLMHVPFARAAHFGLYPFLAAETMKIMLASAAAARWQRWTM